MKRGELWTAAGSGYTSKPRPVVIIQTDLLETLGSVIVCPITTDPTDALFRPDVAPSAQNGLRVSSRLMADKLTALRRDQLDQHIGVIDRGDMDRLERALAFVLGLGG